MCTELSRIIVQTLWHWYIPSQAQRLKWQIYLQRLDNFLYMYAAIYGCWLPIKCPAGGVGAHKGYFKKILQPSSYGPCGYTRQVYLDFLWPTWQLPWLYIVAEHRLVAKITWCLTIFVRWIIVFNYWKLWLFSMIKNYNCFQLLKTIIIVFNY